MVALRQHAQNSTPGGGSSVTVTLGSATVAGNALIVAIGTVTSTVTISSVALGGVTTGFAQDVTVSNTTNPTAPISSFIWSNDSIASGQTSVVVTASTSTFLLVDVFDV